MNKQVFTLVSDQVRRNAISAIADAPEGYTVTLGPKKRSSDQNAFLHALCDDLARSQIEWFGKRRNKEDWKQILISGHATATGFGGELVPGIEGELVAIRESSAAMSVGRANSLLEYVLAFCLSKGIELRETRRGGFYDDRRAA